MALTREILDEMARRQSAKQLLKITFTNGQAGIDALDVVLKKTSVIFALDGGKTFAMAIVESGQWADHRGDRSFIIQSPDLLNDVHFLACVEKGVETIIPGGSNPLYGLQSRRQQKRQEVFDAIVKNCITDDFREFVDDWDLHLNIELQEIHGLYGIEICVVDKDKDDVLYLRVFLDAWSGKVLVGKNNDIRFHFFAETGALDVQKLLEEELTQSLDALTR